jgi:periplasmic protein TonB
VTDRVFAWWLIASLGVHAAGLMAVSRAGTSIDLSPRPAVAIEIVRMPTPEPPPPSPPPPRATPAPPRVVPPAPAPTPVEAAPQVTPNLLDSPAPPRATVPSVDGTFVPSTMPSAPGPVVGAPAGAGRLFASGDLLVAPGPGSAAGSGASGPRGQGMAETGAASSQVAALGTGLTALARPLGGGYQVKPEYPDRAIRDRAQGVTLLSVEVLSTGRVGQVIVKRSAGHRDLDHAAMAAVKQWQFEPARRGPTPVTVWATLPVRFELTDR